jgi:MYXO-CTERM domain-containing protein
MTPRRLFPRPSIALRSLVIAAGLAAAAAGSAQATAVMESTYYFNANCADCAVAANSATFGVLGTLVLQGYTAGDAISESNFVSFTYSGSNLIPGFTVNLTEYTVVGSPDPVPTTVYALSGAIPETLPSTVEFDIEFGDGLGFKSHADGSFYVCGPGLTDYYANDCTAFFNNDQGTGSFSTVNSTRLGPDGQGTVPEPDTALLAALGLLAAARRRRDHA